MITTTGWDGTGVPQPNSCRISMEVGDSLADYIAAVEAFLTTHSWALYDAAAGTNARCYRCLARPDSQGVTHYGYVVLSYNTAGYLLLMHYGSWNATTHVGTDLANYSQLGSGYNQVFPAYSGGLFTSAGWLKIQASQFGIYLVGNNGTSTGTTVDHGPTFVVQRSRTCAEDIAALGFPKWAWGCTNNMGACGIQFPLSASKNRTGASTAAFCGINTDFGHSGNLNSYMLPVQAANRLMPLYLDALTGKLNYSNIRMYGQNADQSTTEAMGTLLDLIAVTGQQGVANVDDITFNALEENGAVFVHADGTPFTFWLIGGNTLRLAIRK